MKYKHYGLWNIQIIIFVISIIMYQSVKMKSVFEKYLSNTPKYANQIQIQIFHLVGFQIQIQIQIQIFAYLNTNTNTYLTPALAPTSKGLSGQMYDHSHSRWSFSRFFSQNLEGRESVALDALDEVVVLSFPAESCCCQVDPSSSLFDGWACSPSSGACNSIESSIESCILFAAATALRFCFCLKSLVKRHPRFWEPISTDVTQRFSGTQRKSVVETTLLAAMMVVTEMP